MKKRVLLGMASLLLSVSLLMAQEIPAGVITAFKRGSSQELSKYMGDKVNLVLQGSSANVDKKKATAMMQEFFTENKVNAFDVNHQGKRDESSFVIGTLTTTKGKFRVNCFLKKVQTQYLIHQIRIDKINEKELIDKLIDLAFAEDIGDGDHTTLSCIPATAMGKSKLLIKEAGVLAGIEVAKEIFNRFDPSMKVEVFINDGTEVKPGDVAMIVEGKVQSLLQTECLMLNVMQRMSGIATMTRKYARQLEGTHTRVLDTRKTTPGMRILEKMAVKIGGGVNHRIGLFDMILLKDNHVDFAGGIDKAINRAKDYCKEKGKDLKIEIEVRNFDELQQVLDLGGVDRIMFDNFTPEMTKKAVDMVAGKYETESSGGITFDTLRDYAECGVDFISVGALTHSVKGLDMSFKAC